MSRADNVALGELLAPRNEIVHPRDKPTGEGVFVGLEHVEPGSGRRTGLVPIRLEELTGRKARFHPGDIIYGYLRPYLNKVWVADFDGYCSVDQYVFQVNGRAAVEYVSAFMRSPTFLERAPIAETPGQLPRIRLNEILGVPIALPAIDEQRRIATHLTDQLAAVERARHAASQGLVDIQVLRRRVVSRAFDDPSVRRTPLASLGVLTDGDWILTADYAPGGVRLLQVGDVGSGSIRLKSSRYITAERARELGCTFLQPGDLLISRMPEPLGRACILPDLGYPTITAVDVTIFRPDVEILDREFASYYMSSRQWLGDVASKASGATRPRISRRNLEATNMPAPHLREQRRVVGELRELIGTIDEMTDAIEIELEASEALLVAVLRRTFEDVVT